MPSVEHLPLEHVEMDDTESHTTTKILLDRVEFSADMTAAVISALEAARVSLRALVGVLRTFSYACSNNAAG